MKYILTSGEMQQCDKNTMEHFGLLSAVLMERAALATVEEIVRLLPDKDSCVLVACGTGNNGGDGLAIARLLHLQGYRVEILLPGDMSRASEEAARQLSIAGAYGMDFIYELPGHPIDCIVDAIFGIGLSRNIEGNYKKIIGFLNDTEALKVAVDIPSGVNADNGHIMGVAFRADVTVTFGFAKVGQLVYPGAGYVGELFVKDIGIDHNSLLDMHPHIGLMEPGDLSFLPERSDDSNKGTYGKILVFAGSCNMAGAAVFSAKAAYRTGAGLVKVVTDNANREIIQTLVPEAILATYDEKTDMEELVREQLGWADAVVIGPGIGLSGQAVRMVQSVVENAEAPCLIDADGLNILASHPDWLLDNPGNMVVTPHPGEMSRLSGSPLDEIKDNLIRSAESFAGEYGVVTVLKDSRTVIACPDRATRLNITGNDGMATGGSGDVLTGIIGAIMARSGEVEDAAALGVLLHGLAGDAAAKKLGTAAMTATDIIDGIGSILKMVYDGEE
ncbi:MAG: NAD(P)H-hydrate dehydratase [Clostridiales bacterium]|nr:NAD(P)H-hydrate dehydratase [Clostridiales bacterium]